MDIYVSKLGIISALGNNVDESLYSLQSGRTGITMVEEEGLMMGQVPLSNKAIHQQLKLPQLDYSRTSLLGLWAIKEIMGNGRLSPRLRTGLISATSVGGIDRMEEYYFEDQASGAITTTHLMTHDNGRTTERMAAELGLSGYIGTIATACSSGANAIMLGARMMRAGQLDQVIVGGADPLAQLNIKGFCSLSIYDQQLCKPFDQDRNGLNLGEGAAFLLLENERSLNETGNQPLCMLSGWNNATDAYHQTASSDNGEGATLAMRQALELAALPPEAISYLNAHGTGTQNNDLSESVAIQRVFGDDVPAFSSTKGFTGHTLAAAGAIEAVLSVLAISRQLILPNIHFTTPMVETGLRPATNFQEGAAINHVLSNSFGFGGNCSTLIFSKIA